MSKHRWVEGKGHEFAHDVRAVCTVCNKQFMLSTGWADAAGAPFKAYYCAECKEKADG